MLLSSKNLMFKLSYRIFIKYANVEFTFLSNVRIFSVLLSLLFSKLDTETPKNYQKFDYLYLVFILTCGENTTQTTVYALQHLYVSNLHFLVSISFHNF